MWSSVTVGRDLHPIAIANTIARQRWLDTTYPPSIQSSTMVGIEIECENHRGNWDEVPVNLRNTFELTWQQKEDGSLRNRGVEYVTHAGITASQASQALRVLSDVFRNGFPNIEANARTGVHIHLNCLNKTAKQIAAFMVAYCLVEKSLFLFSGGRTENIFCVPVRASDNLVPEFLRLVRKNPDDYQTLWRRVRHSPKYLAFNIGALGSFGTIELRHAQGTNNPETVLPWLTTLVKLFDYATSQDLEPFLERVRLLNTNSQYETVMRDLLTEEVINSVGTSTVIADMVQGSTYVKMALIEPEEPEGHPEERFAILDDMDDNPPPAPRHGASRPGVVIGDDGGAVILPREVPVWSYDQFTVRYNPERSIYYLVDSDGVPLYLTYNTGRGFLGQADYVPWEDYQPDLTAGELLALRDRREQELRAQLREQIRVRRPAAPQLGRRVRNNPNN